MDNVIDKTPTKMETPIPRHFVDNAKKESGLVDIGKA